MSKNIIFDPQMTTYDQAALEGLVESLKPMHALEIGSWKGLSSSIIARHSKVLYCIDTWEGAENEKEMHDEAKDNDVFGIFRNNIKCLGLTKIIKPLIMSSFEARVLFKEDHLDFIYIDGNHAYESVKLDLDWFLNLKKGGTIAGHDYDLEHPDVIQIVNERFPDSLMLYKKSSLWSFKKE